MVQGQQTSPPSLGENYSRWRPPLPLTENGRLEGLTAQLCLKKPFGGGTESGGEAIAEGMSPGRNLGCMLVSMLDSGIAARQDLLKTIHLG